MQTVFTRTPNFETVCIIDCNYSTQRISLQKPPIVFYKSDTEKRKVNRMRRILLAVAASLLMSAPAFAEQEKLTPEVIYQPILNNYTEVINASLNGANAYELGKNYGLDYYWLNTLPNGADVQYAFYDIDQNGIPELFIQNSSDLFDAFGYDGNNIVRLFDTSGVGNRGKFTLYQNGIIEILSYGGQASVYEFYRMSTNGLMLEKIDQLYQSFDQYNRNGNKITGYEFQQIINTYESVPKVQLSWKCLPNVVYRGSLLGELEKKDGIYWYSGIIQGYNESLTLNGDWTDGFYDLTSGDFYVDDSTRVVIETKDDFGDYGFPAEGKTATEWLDDFYARRDYWMVVNLKVRGNHIEEILGIYAID